MNKTIYPLPAGRPDGGKVAFSSGVRVAGGDLLFISGQLGRDEGKLVGIGDIRAQTRQVLENIKRVLDLAGAGFEHIVKVTVFIKDMAHFREIHDVRLQYFPEEHLPASTMVEVSGFTDPDALIEIEAIAVLPPASG